MNLFAEYMNTDLQDYVITITKNLPQKFAHKFADGRVFTIELRYNPCLDNWFMDIYQQSTNVLTPIALNIVLQYGLDLLSQFKYKDIGEFYVCSKNPNEYYSPNKDTLNSQFWYVWRHK